MTDPRRLGGRYEVGPVLGYGGMAEVHRSRDLRLGRDVAIKVLRSDLARDAGFQARFRREAQNSAALNHPAIVAVYDTGQDSDGNGGNVPYIVMEYVEGQTLKEVLTAETRLMPQRALEITADICAALEFSHRHGIVHRDIKPGNVMLTPNGTVKVMDFGIARAMAAATSTMTATSAVIGTAQYLSPEQARGETVDARSDVYSTGCMLYELLTGQPPFTGDNPVSVAYQHVREDPVPPTEVNPELPPAIDAIVLKAMAKNPANRYQSAGEMRADLLRAVAGRPVAATPVLPADERTQVIGPTPATRPNGYVPRSRHVAPEPSRRRALTIAMVVLGVVLVFSLAAFGTAYLLGNSTQEVTVPNVIGKNVGIAKLELTQKGFKVTEKPVASTAAQLNTVLKQTPAGDKAVEQGSEVVIEVGTGPNKTTVPMNLLGTKVGAATAKLEAAKFTVKVTEVDSAEPKGEVVRVVPDEGAQVDEKSQVELHVSKHNLVKVPDVVGMTEEGASSKLRAAKLRVEVRAVTDPGKKPGTVVRQDPDPDQLAKPGSTVTIEVVAEPSPSPSPSETTEPPPIIPAPRP